MKSAPTLGNRSQNCPEIICYDTCAPCEHKQYVFDNSTNFNGRAVGFEQVIESMLSKHDDYVAALCAYIPDICKRGELVNFPCIQCGLIDPECITFGPTVYNLQSCTGCVCFQPIYFTDCTISNVDLSTPTYLEIYTDMIEALEQLAGGFANGQTAEDFLKLFLPQAELLFFDNGTYHFSIGQATAEVLAILPLLADLAPIPLGAKLQYYLACPDATDPLGNNPATTQTLKLNMATETGENTATLGDISVEVAGADALIVTPQGLQISGFFGSTVTITFSQPTLLGDIVFNNPGSTADVENVQPAFIASNFPANAGFSDSNNQGFQITGVGVFTFNQVLTTISFDHLGSPGSALTIDCLSITN